MREIARRGAPAHGRLRPHGSRGAAASVSAFRGLISARGRSYSMRPSTGSRQAGTLMLLVDAVLYSGPAERKNLKGASE
jgi:hypothetical protein